MAARGDDPTRDNGREIEGRDALLTAGGEAEWCHFDPILSTRYGRRYRRNRSEADLREQAEQLNRSLAQVARADPPRCDAFRCPELDYDERGRLQTSMSSPLALDSGQPLDRPGVDAEEPGALRPGHG